jgi:hypothetical protein
MQAHDGTETRRRGIGATASISRRYDPVLQVAEIMLTLVTAREPPLAAAPWPAVLPDAVAPAPELPAPELVAPAAPELPEAELPAPVLPDVAPEPLGELEFPIALPLAPPMRPVTIT